MKRQFSDISQPFAGSSGLNVPRKAARIADKHRNNGRNVSAKPTFEARSSINEHKCKPVAPGGHRCCPESLLDLAAKVSAATTPFQLVEERCVRVPGPVMQKFIYWSFPRLESDIRRYSALSCDETTAPPSSTTSTSQRSGDITNAMHNSSPRVQLDLENRTTEEENAPFSTFGVVTSSELDGMEVPFEKGIAMAESGKVKDVLQIGFHLSGSVDGDEVDPPGINEQEDGEKSSFHVAINFDRCKITSASCDCRGGNIFFCKHVVTIRLPISETLQQMDRDQLQKLTQYLLAHHNRVLPSAQRVADLLVDPTSQINAIRGAPDPTAGAGLVDEDRWSLEDKEAARHVSSVLENYCREHGAVQLQSLIAKVREMLRARDCNGPRLLTLITKELMRHCSTHTHVSSFANSISCPRDLCRLMWDQLGLLWVCVVLNPKISAQERQAFVQKLEEWQSQPHCPQESGDGESLTHGRTVLSRAVDAGNMKWDDAHLTGILKGTCNKHMDKGSPLTTHYDPSLYDIDGQPLWHEYVPTACARVEALRSHGCEAEAISLAAAIATTIKRKWTAGFRTSDCQSATTKHIPLPQDLIGHPLHPIHILFDTLSSAELCADSCYNGTKRHAVAAYEVALMTLGQHRTMPEGFHNQQKMIACEAALIKRLTQLQLDDKMVSVLQNVSKMLIEGGSTSGLGQPIKRESVPLHNFSKYIFNSLLPHDRKLAFRVGIRAMQVPVFYRSEPNYYAEAYNQPNPYGFDGYRPNHFNNHGPQGQSPRCFIGDKLEANQCSLASSLIQSAKGEVILLRDVVESVERTICNPQYIFQLSHDAYKAATPPLGPQDSSMLNVSLQMGMQVLRMTIHGGSWRRTEMVGWLVTCATEIGKYALISIIKIWNTLFTPVEATTMLANCVVSPNTAVRLNLHPRQRDELLHCVCQMAIQCAVKDPQSCALCCLTLCENFPSAFHDTYRVIVDASNQRRIDATQLYSISRYLNQKGLRQRAFNIAFAATRCLSIAFNHDAHPATSDLLWAMQLAQSLGQGQLNQMVSVVSQNVACASVLSDVLRTCTSGINSRDTANMIHFGERNLRADSPILRPLLEAAIRAYQVTIHTKLSHISPRHYTEFIDFLNKARETFLLSANGHERFSELKDNLKTDYKGKKKLLNLVALRFG